MNEQTIIVTIYGFDESKWEALARTEDGKEIRVDPFVSGDWEWGEREQRVGRYEIYGFYHFYGAFIPLQKPIEIGVTDV